MSIAEQNTAGDVSLDAIEVMAQAEGEFNPCPGDIYRWRPLWVDGMCRMMWGACAPACLS